MSPRVANYNDRLADYVDVKERIRLFYEKYPDGRLVTSDVRATIEPDGVPRVWVEAAAYRTPDDPLPGRGWSWLVLPGSTPYTKGSELENAETSAWGRAIGSLGIGIERSIASQDEVNAKEGEEHREAARTDDGGLIGVAEIGKGQADFELRQTPEGFALAFRLVQGRHGDQGRGPRPAGRRARAHQGRRDRQAGDLLRPHLRRDVPATRRDEGRHVPGAHPRPDRGPRLRPPGARPGP
jgi:hypothetical protein